MAEAPDAATYYTGATHPTLYSGVELGEHSQYYLMQWSPDEQRLRYRRSFEAPELIWERLAQAGKRTLAIDPYEGFPPRGPQASSSPASSSSTSWGSRSGRRPAAPGEPFDASAAEARMQRRSSVSRGCRAFCRCAAGSRRRRAAGDAAVGLLGEQAFDFVWLTFLTTHIGGHQFWDMSQLDEDALDESERALFLSTLPDMYESVDRQLDRVVRALPRTPT